MRAGWVWCPLALALSGCTESTGGGDAGGESPPEDGATAIAVDVPPSGHALVRLATAEVLALAGRRRGGLDRVGPRALRL